MAVLRDRPYAGFNFLVDLGDGESDSPQAGFQEIEGLGHSIEVIEYRAGNSKSNHPIKLAGLSKVHDLTCRRGVVGSLDLHRWLEEIRTGSSFGLRTVTISLLAENREPVLVWRLENARIRSHRWGALQSQASAVAIEELSLSAERLLVE